jgi:PAS domain S-box-containing protein
MALEAAANAIVLTDRDGTIRWLNSAFERLTGYSREEALGRNSSMLKSGRQDAAFYRALWDRILAGSPWQGELVNKRKDGGLYTEEMTITPVMTEAQGIGGFIAIKSDVTERELSRERLMASLEEKEVLLREIHHRINNNMQLIISLLNLSARKGADEALREPLSGISRRIQSMALVHEQFYNSPDMARIDFGLCLRQLADGLYGEFQGSCGAISVASDSQTILLGLEEAVPAGLAAAELITNALMHAYPGPGPGGPIRVSLRRSGAGIELSVRDEGVGMPPGLDLEGADSLGMVLVRTLASQLRGKIEYKDGGGTEAILGFPAS